MIVDFTNDRRLYQNLLIVLSAMLFPWNTLHSIPLLSPQFLKVFYFHPPPETCLSILYRQLNQFWFSDS